MAKPCRTCAKCKIAAVCLGGSLDFYRKNRMIFAVGGRAFGNAPRDCQLPNSNNKRRELVSRYVRGEA